MVCKPLTVNNYTIKYEMKQKKNGLVQVVVPGLFNNCTAGRKHSNV